MSELLSKFEILDKIPQNIKQIIKIFYIFREIERNFDKFFKNFSNIVILYNLSPNDRTEEGLDSEVATHALDVMPGK